MAKKLKRKEKSLENQHKQLIQPFHVYTPIKSSEESNSGYMVVSVATYGAYQAPIEGWSQLNAGLVRSSRGDQ